MRCRPAISSHSLGRAWVHDIGPKLDQAGLHGLDVEIFYEDLRYLAQTFAGGATAANEIIAASVIRSMCDERGILVVCLQPFMHYEGLRDRRKHAERIEEMKHWIQLAKALQTSIIAIPSTCLSKDLASDDLSLIVKDMREVADLAAAEHIKLTYESLAWGTYVDTWEKSWKIVELVDRPNFLICLDTFNIAARVYADPMAPSRKTIDADEEMSRSLERLIEVVDVKKIGYVQVVDAEFLPDPLIDGHEFYNAEQPARMSWSRNCRLFYGEEDRGAYLPITAILKTVLVDLGFEGWISAEMFNKSLTDPDPCVPRDHAKRALASWQKIVQDFGLETESEHSSQASQSRTKLQEQRPRAQL